MHILALDDEAGALKILTSAIEAADSKAIVCGFTDSDAALEYAKNNHVDVAFLDIRLPGIWGLDIAAKLRVTNPDINLIFTTGYYEYAVPAFELRSSGYLLKPITRSAVARELQNLRNPVSTATAHIYARCFGNFDLFVDSVQIDFPRKLSKELLAYLIDLDGIEVSRRDLADVLFEHKPYSRTTQSYLTQIVHSLKETLEKAGVSEILVSGSNSYKIDPYAFTCDAYEYLDGKSEKYPYRGLYMEQYSWAEYSKSKFCPDD